MFFFWLSQHIGWYCPWHEYRPDHFPNMSTYSLYRDVWKSLKYAEYLRLGDIFHGDN